LLVITNTVIAFVHVTVRPYSSKILNIFEGMILHQMILVSMVPVIENFDQHLMSSVSLTLPLTAFVIMELIINKVFIMKIIACCVSKSNIISHNTEIPVRDIGIIVDDSMRQNATVVDM